MTIQSREPRTYPSMSRDEIEAMIADGRKIVIFGDHVLKVDAWLPYHPGGDTAMLHMVGRDATAEIEALHSEEAKQRMLRYRIGKVDGVWKNFVAPIQGGTFRTLEEIKDASSASSSSSTDGDSAKGDSHSTPDTSRSPSPDFESPEQTLKHRQGKSNDEVTKIAEHEITSTVPESIDGMSYLDSVTREHIRIDLDKYPDLEPQTQAHIIAKYRELHQRVQDEGLYNINWKAYAFDISVYVTCFSMMLLCILRWNQFAIGGIFLGHMWHQLVFTAHDAGHMGITHRYHIDSLIGIMIANYIGGLSMGWWKRNHNVHHIMTNAPEHDPDIEYLPLFAISHRLLGSLRSTFYDRVMKYDGVAKFLLKFQAWTYFPFLALGRFNLYFLSWNYLLNHKGHRKGPGAWHRWIELAGQVFFWIWFGYGILYRTLPNGWARFVFIMTSHIASSPLHLQIVLSHFAMSTADLGPQESFPQKMLRTTMDVECPEWLDWSYGGLNFQVMHHLFPRMPRHNLRRGQKLLQEFCDEVDLPYAFYGFGNSNKQVIGRLSEVSRQASILAKCQRTIASSGDFSGHGHHHHHDD